ncbi:hypothetical protein MAR_033345 [Mya arenaria]|uniref:DDE Tnp4 domain-containing protein n=1 Tax=Mya arenaria TaxID=6604 RepID=A0ABY7GC42_MYAAR|nr:hypothetical protein MAR_033345 [Mya arenaria]
MHNAYIFTEDNGSIQGGHANGYYLLGDSGYPAKRLLLTPYLAPQNGTEEGYNRYDFWIPCSSDFFVLVDTLRQAYRNFLGINKSQNHTSSCGEIFWTTQEKHVVFCTTSAKREQSLLKAMMILMGVQLPPNVAGNRFRDHAAATYFILSLFFQKLDFKLEFPLFQGHDFHAGAAVTAAVVVSVVAATTSRTVDNVTCGNILYRLMVLSSPLPNPTMLGEFSPTTAITRSVTSDSFTGFVPEPE